ncbi:MAG: protein tyrosine phosphatase family protein [Scytonematopsis contorta HA4267-MV1]|jgi:uncharacterized protein (TIGR01244 family)|nr:protein tyrosine phosphatase family protein [Scytonematopsis contorta HA4267-MV1]
MSDVKKVSDNFSVSGQVTPEELKQAAEEGFKSVLNLRTPNEQGVLADEQEHAEKVGLDYANVPLQSNSVDEELVAQTLWEIDKLPKPVLFHCGAGLRAGAIALIATAIEEGLTLEQLTVKAQEIGLSLEQPHLQHFIQKTYENESVDD